MGWIDVFIETLQEKMTDRNLNKFQLAKELGLDHTSVNSWFNKEFYPRIVNLIRIADLFGCSIDYLFGLTDIESFIPSKIPSDFITRFDKLQLQNKINDNRIATYCKIGSSAVAKWRRFKRYPETTAILKLVGLFDCSIEYLIGRSDI
jgi:transcriptional regulator with XRE-family HTH domain